jgi:hypothetical protein
VERGGFEPPKDFANRFTVCPLWPLGNLSFPQIFRKNLIPKSNVELAMGFEPATC